MLAQTDSYVYCTTASLKYYRFAMSKILQLYSIYLTMFRLKSLSVQIKNVCGDVSSAPSMLELRGKRYTRITRVQYKRCIEGARSFPYNFLYNNTHCAITQF